MEVENTVDVETSEDVANEGAETQDLNNDTDKDWKQIAENQRIRAEKAEARLKSVPDKGQPAFDPNDVIEKARSVAREEFEQRDLQDMSFPDEIKEEVKTLASLKNISVKQAAQLPYIQSLVQEHERAEKVKASSIDTSGNRTTSYTFDPATPPDVDLTTPEGQAEMLKWEQNLERMHNGQ